MTGGRGLSSVQRGARPDHPLIRATSTLAQLEALTRAEYRGVPRVPAGAPVFDWRVCGCDYVTPLVDGRPVLQAENPAYDWSEEANRTRRPVLSEEVRRLVLLYGLGYFHARDAFRSFPGFPDCTIWTSGHWLDGINVTVGPGRLVRELKPMADTKFYGQQLASMTSMRLAGDDVGTWKPCCLLSGRISAELMALAGVTEANPRDQHARPGAWPAVSGTRYDPGAIAADPPARPVVRAPRKAAALAAGAAAAAALVDDLDAAGIAAGYVLNTVGTVDELQARAIGRLRAWAVDWGVDRVDLVWPWRLVVTDNRYWLQVRDRAAGKNGRRWFEIVRLPGSPVPVVELVESLNPRRVSATGAQKCMSLIDPSTAPGGTASPATQGDPE